MGEINWNTKCWVTTIFLVRNDARVLLSWNKNLQAWIPVGGHIDPGETPEDAIMREVAEETGFQFEFASPAHYENNGRLRVVKPYRFQIENVPHHGKHMNFVFFGKVTSTDTSRTATDEDEKLRWFSAEELQREEGLLENVRKSGLEALAFFASKPVSAQTL